MRVLAPTGRSGAVEVPVSWVVDALHRFAGGMAGLKVPGDADGGGGSVGLPSVSPLVTTCPIGGVWP